MMRRTTMVSMPRHQTVMASMLHQITSWSWYQLPVWTPHRRGSLCSVVGQMASQVLMRRQS